MQSIKKYTPLLLIFLIYFLVLLTQPAIIDNIWQYGFDDGTYSHAFLIPLIVIYLYGVLFKENQLIINEKINILGISSALIIASLLTMFSLAQVPFGFRLFLPLFITSLIAIIFKPTFKVLFPSLFLVFLLPIWGVFTPYLQKLSTVVTSYIMGLSGIPIYVEDNLITIPEGVFEIAGGCSGLRYLIVSLAVSSLFIFLNIRKYTYSLLFIGIAVFGALFTNWIRITALILIGHFTNMESSLMEDHNTFGWYLYVPFMIYLFHFGQKLVDENIDNIQDKHIEKKTAWQIPLLISILFIFFFSQVTRSIVTNVNNDSVNVNNCVATPTELPLPTLFNYTKTCAIEKNDFIELTYFYDGSSIEGSLHFYLNSFYPENWNIENTQESHDWKIITVNSHDVKYKIKYHYTVGERYAIDKYILKELKFRQILQGNFTSSLTWRIYKN